MSGLTIIVVYQIICENMKNQYSNYSHPHPTSPAENETVIGYRRWNILYRQVVMSGS